MSLSSELEKLKYDKRLLDWHVNRGKISKDEVKRHFDSLPDLASNVESFDLGDERGSSRGGEGGSSSGDQGSYNG